MSTEAVGIAPQIPFDPFVAPPSGITIHCNQSDAKLQLQVDLFCEDICLGVTEWLEKVPETDLDVRARMDGLMKVINTDGSFAF